MSDKFVLKVKVPKFIIRMLDKSGLLSLEKSMTEKEMSQLAIYNYEHRTAEGKVRGSGKTYVDWLGNIHIIQKDSKGKKVYESIHLPDGGILIRR